MAREVVWSLEAISDLDTQADFIAKDSPFYAASFVAEIREASRTLAVFSERGRTVPELNNKYIRELIIKDYRLIYLVEENRVTILSLIHSARRLRFSR